MADTTSGDGATSGDGDCFEVALSTAMADTDLTVCHGLVTGEAVGEHWHAWCERSQTYAVPGSDREVELVIVVDKSNGGDVNMLAEVYYKSGRIEHVWRYPADEALTLMAMSGTAGPWNDGWETMGDGTARGSDG